MIIRAAHPSEIESLLAMDRSSHSNSTHQSALRRAASEGNLLLAMRCQQAAGYVILEYSFFNNGFISLLYVAEAFRRQGIAAALLRHAERICRRPKLFTSTNASNLPMRRLLLKIGFRVSGMVENLDENDPELFFFKIIPSPLIHA